MVTVKPHHQGGAPQERHGAHRWWCRALALGSHQRWGGLRSLLRALEKKRVVSAEITIRFRVHGFEISNDVSLGKRGTFFFSKAL